MMLISADEVWTLGIQLSFLYSRQSIFCRVNYYQYISGGIQSIAWEESR